MALTRWSLFRCLMSMRNAIHWLFKAFMRPGWVKKQCGVRAHGARQSICMKQVTL